MSFSPREKEKPPSPEPGPFGVSHRATAGHERATRSALRDLLHAMLALLDAAEGVTTHEPEEKAEPRMERETPPAPVSPPEPRSAPRADGLRWDERDQPELAQALSALRDQYSDRDGGRAWEDSRRVEPSWCMRAYSHAVLRLLRGPEQGRRVKDAWGLYLKTVGELVGARGKVDAPGLKPLEHVACWPDAAEGFEHARAELARSLERRSFASIKAGLGIGPLVVDDKPPIEQLAAAQRAGKKLIGLPKRVGEDLARMVVQATISGTGGRKA